MSNERARKWLESQRFSCVEEPAWITQGQKPDFFCEGPCELWVEVKTLGHEPRFEQLAEAHQDLRTRAREIQADARAMAWVRTPLEAHDAKKIIDLTDRELNRDGAIRDGHNVIVMIPDDPVYDQYVRFSFQTNQGKLAIIASIMSASGKYGWPAYITPSDYSEEIEVLTAKGESQKKALRQITTFNDNVRVAIELLEGSPGFDLLSTGPVGAASKVNTVERIRQAVHEANSQSKNGCKYHPAPSLAIVFHDDILVAEDEMVIAALYGDLTYTAPANRFQDGQLVFAQNGIFGPDKNTTTSCLCYVRNDTQPLIVHNLWAEERLPPNLLRGKHIIPEADGTFRTEVW